MSFDRSAAAKLLFTAAILTAVLQEQSVAQMDSAKIFGFVVDRSGHYLANVDVELVDVDRGVRVRAKTNSAGFYVFPDIKPANYRLEASAFGYQTATVPSIAVVLQDNISQSFVLFPAQASATMQSASSPINISGSVTTVVDNNLVANLPLNGRSFQTLFQLIPGIVITPTTFSSQGQISVNGQRTDANYFVVDGVSGNFGIAAGANPGQSAGGWLPALSVFGSTNSLVSTEDVQEFAVLTSSYSAEFGRVPGGQISIVTRSGTNRFTGNVFEYLRNDAMDANDWFANNKGLRRPALRQNDFGGVVGGPIVKDKTFFFFSVEALHLRQPTLSSTLVPSLQVRNLASAAVKPFLNAYPLPNGPDNGDGLAQATYGFSNPSSLSSLSFRLDHHFREALSMFVRYAYSTSDAAQRGAGTDTLSTVTAAHFGQHTLTAGLGLNINQQFVNSLRFNWSYASAASTEELDTFGGAIPIQQQLVFPPGFNAQSSLFQFTPTLTPGTTGLELGRNVRNSQTQLNFLDEASWQFHGQLIKLGIDFRKLAPQITPAAYEQESFFQDIPSALANNGLFAAILASVPVHGDVQSYSVFAQDSWRPLPRMTATVGLRWDFAPTPVVRGANGLQPFVVIGFTHFPQLALSRQETPLYRSPLTNFAPRIGFAYEIRRSTNTQSVLKGGAGIYYDLSDGSIGNTLSAFSFPFAAERLVSGGSFPLTQAVASPPPVTTNAPFALIQAFPNVLRTPYSYHWNFSFEQAIGTAQTGSISYVGAAGHRLLRTEEYLGGEAGLSSSFTQLLLTNNAGYSDFNSLQAKFVRRAGRAHLIASYSWSHVLDNVSTDVGLPTGVGFSAVPSRFLDPRNDYGPSDFDIRHSANLGVDYTQLQLKRMDGAFGSLLSEWSVDAIAIWRSSPPTNPVVSRDIGFGLYDLRPDRSPGVPLYTVNPNLPGGRMINAAALSVPAEGRQGNLSRNFFRGFPLFETDLAIRRSFLTGKRVRLQLSAEAFNLFNHPNFAAPVAQLGVVDPQGNLIRQANFGISQTTAAQGFQGNSFASGFSALYQIGGARSLQIAAKLSY